MTLLWSTIVVPSLQLMVRPRTVILLQVAPKSYEKVSARDGDMFASSSAARVLANKPNAGVTFCLV